MSIPSDLKYTKSHEWVGIDAEGIVSVGITHHAQDLLGDMVFVENPVVGRKLAAGEECAVVESVKAASDVYAPIAGEVVAANEELEGRQQYWLIALALLLAVLTAETWMAGRKPRTGTLEAA